MTLPAFTLVFEAGFAILLLVTIVYAVKLNVRITGLRERDSELREMIGEFDRASTQAQESAASLKSAGIDAERQLKATIERAQALRDDLTFMVEHGERIADRIERSPDPRRPSLGATGETGPGAPASPPVETAPAGDGDQDDDRRYRSEIEQALADVIRSTATAG